MTLKREYSRGPFAVTCDNCGETTELAEDDFADAVEEAKVEGYKPEFIDGSWEHFCRQCR